MACHHRLPRKIFGSPVYTAGQAGSAIPWGWISRDAGVIEKHAVFETQTRRKTC